MLSLKLVRSLVLKETIYDPFHFYNKSTHDGDDDEEGGGGGHHQPCLVFLPTREIIHETYKVAIIARDMGLNFYPDPSLSNIIFSFPSSPNKPLISLPFPSLSSAPVSHLRRLVRLSKGLFKLSSRRPGGTDSIRRRSHSLSLFSRVTRHRVDDIDAFSRVLTGSGWSLFKANNSASDHHNSNSSSGSLLSSGGVEVECFIFRKVEANRDRFGLSKAAEGGDRGDLINRVRELRLPGLDFRNLPLKVLHYVLLMTDDLFYLA